MSLVRCEDCGNQVSPKATTCPKCGCPFKANAPNQPATEILAKGILTYIIIGVVCTFCFVPILGIVLMSGNGKPGLTEEERKERDEKIDAKERKEKPEQYKLIDRYRAVEKKIKGTFTHDQNAPFYEELKVIEREADAKFGSHDWLQKGYNVPKFSK